MEMVQRITAAGADLSPASLDVTLLANETGDKLSKWLFESGQRTVTLAPETGSVRLQKIINKQIADDLETAVARLGQAGILHLKLYFMYGLPTEEVKDLEDTVKLVQLIQKIFLSKQKSRGRSGRISVSINPFVPKPHTPFANEPMASQKDLKMKRKFLTGRLQKISSVSVSGFSERLASLQCLLDRADENISKLLLELNGSWPPAFSLVKKFVPNYLELVTKRISDSMTMPADTVDVGVDKSLLERERKNAKEAVISEPCVSDSCSLCAGCSGIMP